MLLLAAGLGVAGCLTTFDDWPVAAGGAGGADASPSAGTSGNAGAVGTRSDAGAPGIGPDGSAGAETGHGAAGDDGADGLSGASVGGAVTLGGGGTAGRLGASGTGGRGGTSAGGTSGNGGTGGNAEVGHRYARLLALTSIPNDSLTSVAEFELLDVNGNSLPRSGWIASADSQELVDAYNPVDAAIDGDPQTHWQTEWGETVAPLPHHLTLDLGANELVTGFIYTPRQDWYNGRIGAWEFYLSNDPNEWGAPVIKGNFTDTMDVQTRTFKAQ